MTSKTLILRGQDCGFTWSASHLLPGHFKCSRMHGHNYVLDLEIESENLEHGMIIDFVEIKKKIRELVEVYDHRLMLPYMAVISNSNYSESTNMIIKRTPNSEFGNTIWITYSGLDDKEKNYVIPWSDTVLIDDIDYVTAENLAIHFRKKVTEILNTISTTEQSGSVHVTIYEDAGQGARY